MHILMFVIIGIVVGSLARSLVPSRVPGNGGMFSSLIIGVLGSLLGPWLFSALGVAVGGGLIWVLFESLIGAVVILFIYNLITRNRFSNI